jgi:hypothetical protein
MAGRLRKLPFNLGIRLSVMLPIVSILISVLFLSCNTENRPYTGDWLLTLGNDSDSDNGTAITINDDGEVLIGGNYHGSVDFDPSSNNAMSTGLNNYASAFLCNYEIDGSINWALTWDASSGINIQDIACDPDDNIYVTGDYNGSLDIENVNTDSCYRALNATGGYLMKIDADGHIEWIRAWEAYTLPEMPSQFPKMNVAISMDGNIYVTGITYKVINVGYLRSYRNNGDLIDIQDLDLYITDIAMDDTDNIIITGYYNENNGKSNLSPEVFPNLDYSTGSFVKKMDQDFNNLWSYDWDEVTYQSKIVLDSNLSINEFGKFNNEADFDENGIMSGGESVTFINNISEDGTVNSEKTIENFEIEQLIVDDCSNLLVLGQALQSCVLKNGNESLLLKEFHWYILDIGEYPDIKVIKEFTVTQPRFINCAVNYNCDYIFTAGAYQGDITLPGFNIIGDSNQTQESFDTLILRIRYSGDE